MSKLAILGIVLTAVVAGALLLLTNLSPNKANIKPVLTPTPVASTVDFSDTCQTDSDCILINQKYGLSCCYEGACQEIDYARNEWVAVNSLDFAKKKEQKCGLEDKGSRIERCGPAPMCAVRAINDNYQPKCIENKCQKVAAQTDCTSDGNCGEDKFCFFKPPRGPAKGIPGSASNPGKCWDAQTINQTF